MSKINRRDFLRITAMTTVGLMAASCAQPTAEPEPTKAPAAQATAVPAKATEVPAKATEVPAPTSKYSESPMLAELVAAGKLPAVEDRLPEDPCVITPFDGIGQYGGTWRRLAVGIGDFNGSIARVSPVEGPFTWGMDGASIVPSLATKWDVSPDGTAFTFYLRKGIKWSDGEPFTADDIVYVQEDIYNNTDLYPAYPGLLKIGGEPMTLEKKDDYTFTMKFATPYGLFPLNMAADWSSMCEAPAHYMKQFHATYADKAGLDKMVADAKLETWAQLYNQKNAFRDNKDKPCLRAWIMDQTPPETVLTLQRNPYYWKVDPQGNQLPYIDRQRHTVVESVDIVTLRAVAGEIDMQMRNIAFSNYPLLKESADKGEYNVFLWNMAETGVCLFPNQTVLKSDTLRTLFQDIKFRKALQYAVDIDEVNELHYNGLASDMTSTVPEPLKSDATLFAEYVYDVDKANALLDELGLDKRSSAGWRLGPDGQEIAITIETASNWTTVVPVCELIVTYWQKIGINAALKGLMYEGWWDRIHTSEYQVAGYLLENFDPLINLTYPRNYFVTSYDCYWGSMWGDWYSSAGSIGEEPPQWVKDLQTAYDGVKGETDPAKQIETMNMAFKVWLTNHNIIHTVGRYPTPVIVKKNFKNFPAEGVNGWPLRSPGNTRPEQYYMES